MTLAPTLDTSVLDFSDTGSQTGVNLFELLCQRRGWTPEYLHTINNPTHDQLKDIVAMIEALDQIRQRNLTITIAPDFDMDGIASGILGYAGLSELGFRVNLQIPDYRRGHELTPADIDEIAALFPDTNVLLTCDGGVNSHAGLTAARNKGWITLVTDHHQELKPGCNADITVDPCRLDETYAHPGICGATVLYQVLEAYTARFVPHKSWQIRMLRLFAGIGTVSDVMPVLYENRQLVRDAVSIASLLRAPAPMTNVNAWGQAQPDYEAVEPASATLLTLMPDDDAHPVFRRAFLGFAVLLKAFGEAGKLRAGEPLTEQFFGFYLAPAMNSPRRIQTPLLPCFEIFTATSVEAMHTAAQTVIEYSATRKEMTQRFLQEILGDDQPLAPWIYFSDAPTGMQGLLANQLMHLSGLPTVVISRPTRADASIGGSARAPEWFPVIDVVDTVPGASAIGHQQACGVRLNRADRLGDLSDTLRENAALAQAHAATQDTRVADLQLGSAATCDTDLEDVEAIMAFVRRVDVLKPFGHQFPAPTVEVQLAPADVLLRRIGSESQHIQLTTLGGFRLLWWNAAEQHYQSLRDAIDDSTPGTVLRFVTTMQINAFRGVFTPQAIISDRLDDLVLA